MPLNKMIVSTTYIILLLLFFIDVIGIDNDNETGVCSNSQLLDLYIDNQLYNGDDASRTSQCFSLRHKCIKYQDVVLTRDVIDFATDMQVDQDNSGPILSDRDVVIVFQFNSSNASIITYADSVEADIYQAVNLVISLAFNVPNSILNFESGYESITVYNQSIQSTLSTVKHNVGITKSLKQIQSQWLKNADAGDSAISMLDSGGFRIYYALESSKYGMVELPVSIVLSDIKIHTAINSKYVATTTP